MEAKMMIVRRNSSTIRVFGARLKHHGVGSSPSRVERAPGE